MRSAASDNARTCLSLTKDVVSHILPFIGLILRGIVGGWLGMQQMAGFACDKISHNTWWAQYGHMEDIYIICKVLRMVLYPRRTQMEKKTYGGRW